MSIILYTLCKLSNIDNLNDKYIRTIYIIYIGINNIKERNHRIHHILFSILTNFFPYEYIYKFLLLEFITIHMYSEISNYLILWLLIRAIYIPYLLYIFQNEKYIITYLSILFNSVYLSHFNVKMLNT